MSKNVVVFGAGGQLGVELQREFGLRGYQVTGLDRAQVDITRADQVEQAVASAQADVVLNAAAYNQVDVAETEPVAAYQVNALAVRNIALACRQSDARLVHFSTDYVFDGITTRPYTEQDPVHPLGAYAVSKLAGEWFAKAYIDSPLVIRTSGVFGPGGLNTARGNFIELMLRLAHAGQMIRVVEDHIASPTYAPLLAARTADLVEKGVTGIVHCGGGMPISWYSYAQLIFREAGLKPLLIPPNEREFRTPARRPKYSALSNAYVESLGLPAMPSLEHAVHSYLSLRARLVAAG
jgi:dTDP-4-dehydrorhamnose reductase